jgi:hypothetical protein
MHRTGPHEKGRHISHQGSRNARPRTSFYKNTLIIMSYATACAIVAVAMTYSPVSAANILAKINVLPVHLTSAPDASNRIHKADRLSVVSFAERRSAVPMPSAVVGGDRKGREGPQADRRNERIPFSCELAFSRLVTAGNFSTRCLAGLKISQIDT